MARKGYVTTLQRDAAAFAVERAKLDLAAANTAKDVLERFTKDKTAGDLESKRDAAEATMRCDQASFELEETKLKRLTTQLEKCVVHAPQDGMVIFANDSRRDDAPLVEEGALVRERQSILRLPDLSRMQAKVTVHESRIDRVVPGMRARVTVQEREFQGTVHSISSQPESMGWRRGNNAKMYPVIVRIDGTSSDLRPGMTATVEILVANVKGVVAVPEQAIVEQGGRFNCWVTVDGHPQRRPVKLGVSDGRLIEIKDGLAENEQVLLNPRATVPEARLEMPEDFAVDVKRRFGDIAASTNYPPALTQVSSLHKPGDQPTENLDPMGYDKDGDKRLSREEAPPTIRGSFDQLDTNKDGFLDAGEIKVALSPDFKAAQNSPGRPSPLGK
jgi:HlyD family secretion protein